jgi:Fe2+ transport system protein FeoA
MTEQSFPLTMASPEKEYVVAAITAGWGLQRRLAEMGLTTGTHVRIMNGRHSGPLLIEVRGSKLGLGYGAAQKIMVKEVQNG